MVRFVQTQGHAERCDRAAVLPLMLLLRVGERKKKTSGMLTRVVVVGGVAIK